MFFTETAHIVKQFSDTCNNLTRGLLNRGLDNAHKINPCLFNARWIGRLKGAVDGASAAAGKNLELFDDYLRLCHYTTLKSAGFSPDPVITPDKSDRRFFDEDWSEHAAFDCLKQFYLLASRFALKNTLENLSLGDKKTAKKVDFYTRQWLDALSPANFALTNPAVLRETIDTRGENLVRGARALLADFARGKGKKLMPRMTDYESFEVGENIATTPGQVIYQNRLMQLIQYSPSTAKVYETPLLIAPPWINKYYILDLREENSFVKWAIAQGHTVFMISWKNPDGGYADTGFEDYMRLGILAALEQIRIETGQDQANTIGYCIGGALLAATNAWLARKRLKAVKSSTYFTTLLDFAAPGDLGVFIDEEQLKALDRVMAKAGYLDGATMATVFNMLRANDLIWPFFINNYLLGKQPAAFDLLYWNADCTRLPARAHSFFLRQCYLENRLAEKDGVSLNGAPIDLGRIKTPAYFISMREDHIAPWQSTYAGIRLMSGPARFVLGGSGHIAGIINPPLKNKYHYWTNDRLADDPSDWLQQAESHAGSWWPDWAGWAARQAGEKVPARKPGQNLKSIEAAPGSYVKERIVAE